MRRFNYLLSIVLCVYGLTLSAKETVEPSAIPLKDPAALISHELVRLDTLIEATQKSLEEEKKLREQIVEYKKFQEEYLLHSENNDLLFRLVKSGYRTLESIKKNHLEQTFDPDFINELTIVSQPISKRGIPKPG